MKSKLPDSSCGIFSDKIKVITKFGLQDIFLQGINIIQQE